jgi:hypothetical protein
MSENTPFRGTSNVNHCAQTCQAAYSKSSLKNQSYLSKNEGHEITHRCTKAMRWTCSRQTPTNTDN